MMVLSAAICILVVSTVALASSCFEASNTSFVITNSGESTRSIPRGNDTWSKAEIGLEYGPSTGVRLGNGLSGTFITVSVRLGVLEVYFSMSPFDFSW